jgi:16S rRNA (uracil1498-N3)-methyltransferase
VNLFYQPLIPEGLLVLEQEESRHCIKVLRKKTGDVIRVTDGKGMFYDCVLEDPDPLACRFSVTNKFQEQRKNYLVHIAIAPTKSPDRIEWFVEKAVELGIDTISFLECHNSERSTIKKDRLHKIAVSAMKQSLKASLPLIGPLTKLTAFIHTAAETEKYIAYVDEKNPDHLKDVAPPGRDYLVLVGPEGDFTPDELSASMATGFKKVSLGKSRLRTETAGLAACHVLNLLNS